MTWHRLLTDLIRQYGGEKQAFARAVHLSPSALSRLLAAAIANRAPSTEVCLRIAFVTHVSASRILRIAGKGPVADLLESLYGVAAERRLESAATRALTPAEEAHLEKWRALGPKDQRAIALLTSRAVAARIADDDQARQSHRSGAA